MAATTDPAVAYKVIATDLDGTLLKSDGQLSERTVAAIQQVTLSGRNVVIATARPLRDALRIAQALAVSGPIICQNGAVIALTPNFTTFLRKYLLWSPQIRSVVDYVRAQTPNAQIAIDYPHFRLLGVDWPGPFSPGADQPTLWPLTSRDIPARRGAACIMLRNCFLDSRQIIAEMSVTATSSQSGLIEISSKGVTKAQALKRVCEHLNVESEHVLSFGDMPNDITMLKYAGLGVAVGNAPTQVQQAADIVALPNDQDGVAAILEKLLKQDGQLRSRN